MTINLWKTSVRKEALAHHEIGPTIFRQVAKIIQQKPNEEWLIISFKDDNIVVLDEIQKSLPDPLDKTVVLKFIHWGNHCAANDYADIKNIIIIGSWFHPPATYKSMYEASTGNSASDADNEAIAALRRGELESNFLQAFMRSHGRRSFNGLAGEATAHVIASKSPDPAKIIAAALPGCTINEWRAVPIELIGQAKALTEFLRAQKDAGVKTVAKGVAAKAVAINSKQRLSPILGSYLFQEWMQENDVEMGNKHFMLNG